MPIDISLLTNKKETSINFIFYLALDNTLVGLTRFRAKIVSTMPLRHHQLLLQ